MELEGAVMGAWTWAEHRERAGEWRIHVAHVEAWISPHYRLGEYTAYLFPLGAQGKSLGAFPSLEAAQHACAKKIAAMLLDVALAAHTWATTGAKPGGTRKARNVGSRAKKEAPKAKAAPKPPPPPPPPPPATGWWTVIGVGRFADYFDVKSAYRRRAHMLHPDKGGTADAMAELNNAWAEFQRERGR